MKEFTLVINHLVAPSVITNAQHQVLCRAMKEPTQVKNHIVAPIVTTNVQHQAI